MHVLEVLVPLYPINTARVVFSSDSKINTLNLYPRLRWDLTKSEEENNIINYVISSRIAFSNN